MKTLSDTCITGFPLFCLRKKLSTFPRQIFTVSETGPYTVSLQLSTQMCEYYHIIPIIQHSLQYMHTANVSIFSKCHRIVLVTSRYRPIIVR